MESVSEHRDRKTSALKKLINLQAVTGCGYWERALPVTRTSVGLVNEDENPWEKDQIRLDGMMEEPVSGYNI